MKLITILTLNLLIISNCYCQQNFFNVPSSEITSKNNFFFQQQINVMNEGFQSNSTISYGVGKQYEIGINILDLTYLNNKILFNDNTIPYSPLANLNFQKKIERLNLSLGTQLGTNRTSNFCIYQYINSVNYIKKQRQK